MSELFEHIDKLKQEESKVAVATLVNTRGTTPRKEGAKMVVGEGGRGVGSATIGGAGAARAVQWSAGAQGGRQDGRGRGRPRARVRPHRRLRGRPGHRAVRRRPAPECPAAARA